jgi:hypothetical protein
VRLRAAVHAKPQSARELGLILTSDGWTVRMADEGKALRTGGRSSSGHWIDKPSMCPAVSTTTPEEGLEAMCRSVTTLLAVERVAAGLPRATRSFRQVLGDLSTNTPQRRLIVSESVASRPPPPPDTEGSQQNRRHEHLQPLEAQNPARHAPRLLQVVVVSTGSCHEPLGWLSRPGLWMMAWREAKGHSGVWADDDGTRRSAFNWSNPSA